MLCFAHYSSEPPGTEPQRAPSCLPTILQTVWSVEVDADTGLLYQEMENYPCSWEEGVAIEDEKSNREKLEAEAEGGDAELKGTERVQVRAELDLMLQAYNPASWRLR